MGCHTATMGGSLINWPFRQFASMLKALMHANLFDCAFLPTHLSNASSLHRELFLVVSWAPWLQWEPILQQVSPTFRPHHCHFSLSLSAIVDFCAHPNLSLSLSLSNYRRSSQSNVKDGRSIPTSP